MSSWLILKLIVSAMKQANSLWEFDMVPTNHPNKWIGIYNREISPDRFLFREGKVVEDIPSRPTFFFNMLSKQLQKFDVLPNNSASPLVSSAVVKLLSDICMQSVQFLDADVKTQDGQLEEFSLLNITQLVSSIDFEKSQYDLYPNTNYIQNFQKRVHKLNGVSSNLLAREERYKGNIMVADDIYEAFQSNKIKGIQFNPCKIG